MNDVGRVIAELHSELQERIAGDAQDTPNLYLIMYGLQRYRILRRDEDDYSYSSSKELTSEKQFSELLKEGPAVGIHVITWIDTLNSLERTLDRQTISAIDHRVLFQISSSDSSQLIDSPIANKLGFHRALYCSNEQGIQEKFRPYVAPAAEWLEQVSLQLKK